MSQSHAQGELAARFEFLAGASFETAKPVTGEVEPSRPRPTIARLEEFNAFAPPGTFVRFWQSMPAGVWMIAPTTGKAFLHGKSPAVYVRGSAQPIYLCNLEIVSPETLRLLTHADRQPEPAAPPPRPTQLSFMPPGDDQRQLPVGDR